MKELEIGFVALKIKQQSEKLKTKNLKFETHNQVRKKYELKNH